MTTQLAVRGLRRSRSGGLRSAVASWHRPLIWFTAAMALWAVVCAVGLVVDPRLLGGDPIWAKPLKFSISLAVYALTLAWMLSLVTRPGLRRAGWWAGTVGAAASLLEIVVISVQVVRGTGSHFNVSTPLDSALYALMAGGVTLMYTATLIIGGALTIFTRLPDRSVAWALRCGLIIALLGLSVGFLMVIPTTAQLADPSGGTAGSHSVGGDDPSGGLYFLGWNTLHGDLRVAHFIGMHALQALPLLALVLAATQRAWWEGTRLRVVLIAAAGYGEVTAVALWQALRGQSLIHPDGWTWSAVGVIAVLAAAGTAGTVRHTRRHFATCAHCFNTLENESPHWAAATRSSTTAAEPLVREGRLTPVAPPSDPASPTLACGSALCVPEYSFSGRLECTSARTADSGTHGGGAGTMLTKIQTWLSIWRQGVRRSV